MDKKTEVKKKSASKTEQTPYTYSFWSIFTNTFGATFKILIIVVLLVGVVVGFLGLGMVIGWIETAETISEEQLEITSGLTTFIYDVNGNVITKLTGADNINRETVGYDGIPYILERSIVAIEDERFYEHSGFDLIRIFGSVYALVLNKGEIEQGGSTLTQQVYKNYTDRFEQTFERKFQELYNSILLERRFDKKQIITYYANIVNMGNGCYGFQSASKLYFGKELNDITLAEAAFLAGIPNAPTTYNPYTEKGYKATIDRMKNILDKMLELGFISEDDHTKFRAVEVEIQPIDETLQTNKATSYFVDEVIKEVIEMLVEEKEYTYIAAERMVYSNGLHIYTTMDPDVQAAVDKVFQDEETYFNEYDENGFRINADAGKYGEKPQGAVVVMDHKTGAVVALYGGSGEKVGSRTFNRATSEKMERQPGSSFKPIAVYGPALELELITAATVFDDVPSYLDPKNPDTIYPTNYDANEYYGLTPIRNAVKSSINVIAAKVWTLLGRDNSVSFLQSVGIDRSDVIFDNTTVSTATGGLARGVNTYDMANAFATFANQGVYIEGYVFTEVKNHDDATILKVKPKIETAYRSQTAFIMTDIMSGVNKGWDEIPHGGTAGAISIGDEENGFMPVAGKTGTTSDYLDKWFVGYTPYYTAAVWYGYDNRIAPIELAKGISKMDEDGRTYGEYNRAVVLWDAVMDGIHEGLEPKEFERPTSGLIEREVCVFSGKPPSDLCYLDPRYPYWAAQDPVRTEIFIEGTEPSYFDTCEVHQQATICVDSFDPFHEHISADVDDPYGRYLIAVPECPEASKWTIVGIVRPIPYVPYIPDPEEVIAQDDKEDDGPNFRYPLMADDMKWEIMWDETCVVHGMPPNEGETDIIEIDPETGLPAATLQPSESPTPAP